MENHTEVQSTLQDPIENPTPVTPNPKENGIDLDNNVLSHHTFNTIDSWSLGRVHASLRVYMHNYYLFVSDESYSVCEKFYIGHEADDECILQRIAFKIVTSWYLARLSYLGKD